MNDETARVHTQSYGVVNQRERYKRQQHGQRQQHQIHLGKIAVHAVHQVNLISHIRNLRILLQLTGNPLQRVAVGIIRMQLQLKRGWERVNA